MKRKTCLQVYGTRTLMFRETPIQRFKYVPIEKETQKDTLYLAPEKK